MDGHAAGGEDYWNRSFSKGFSFDDEDDPPSGSNHNRSSYRQPPPPPIDDNVSETSFDNTSNIINVTINSVISDDDLKLVLDEQNLDSHTVPKGISVEDELRLLRRRLQYALHAPSVQFTAQKLLLGKKCSLEAFKSLADKEQLLDEMIRIGNGDAILGVVIFLSKTLNKKQFNRILLHRPEAGSQYVNYLVQMRNSDAIDLLTMLGHYQESAVLQMKTVLQKTDSPARTQKMKQLLGDYMNQPGVVPIYYQILNNAISLSELLSKDSPKDKDFATPLQVLHHACTKHKWKDTNLTDPWSPFRLQNEHQISAAQFEWTVLNERTKSQAFLDLESIFEKSSWHSIKQKQFQISFPVELAVLRLHALGAPQAVVYSFLSKVGNATKKLALAKQVQCNRGIADAFVGLKDLPQLERFKESLPEGSEERFYCEQAIKSLSSRRW